MKVKVKKLHKDTVLPKYAKEGDAGLDLVATSFEWKDDRYVFGTGLAFEIPDGFVGLIFPRSSICKHEMRLTNCVGVIDSKYRGEVKFVFENHGMSGDTVTGKRAYKVGDRVGQLIIMPYPQIELEESSELSETARGTGGFGSSGK